VTDNYSDETMRLADRYWEARWRDEKAENDKLRAELARVGEGSMSATIEEQIAEVRRELALRRAVYPKRVREGKMKQHEADRHLGVMVTVLETLEGVKGIRDRAQIARLACTPE
jgi:hypothetical protein